jgi:hypothetical protein
MKIRASWALAAVVVVAVGVLGLREALKLREADVEARGPKAPVRVPRSWRDVRDGFGHVSHTEKGIRCADCHLLDIEGLLPATSDPCRSCHYEVADPLHLVGTPKGPPDCLECHAFTQDRPEILPWGCARCHAGVEDGDAPKVLAHSGEACSSCHQPHATPASKPMDCVSCHEQNLAAHGPEPTDCRACHGGHREAAAARRACADCHASEKPTVVAARAVFAGHDCAECHQPHTPTQKVKACRSCHAPEIAGAKKAKEHRACESCHLAHDAKSSPLPRCASCHEKDVRLVHVREPKTPEAEAAGRCESCHQTHPKDAVPAGLKTCGTSGCHELPASGFHHAAEAKCADCHVPHEFPASAEPKACARCHEPIAARALATEGHDDCAKCHVKGPHAPKAEMPSCESCHEPVASSRVKGHDKCVDCHDPHDGSRGKAADCTSCHAPVAARGHANVKEKGCQSCHRPHGPEGPAEPPACTSCHEDVKKKGLHATPEHNAKCEDCHSAHPTARPDTRDRCLKCHEKLVDHEPKAKWCATCHPFK